MAQAQNLSSRSAHRESIALSDLMAVLSDVTDDPVVPNPNPLTPDASTVVPRDNVLPYPTPKASSADNLVPLRRPRAQTPAKPHLVAVPNSAIAPASVPNAPLPPLQAIAPQTPPALASTPEPQLSPPQAPALRPATPNLAPTSKTLAELTQDLWDLRMVMLSDSDFYGQQITHLQQRVWWLAGIATGGLILLGILLAWLTVNLKDAQLRLANYNDAIANNSLRLEELDSNTVAELTTKVELLNQQVPKNLTDELEAANKDIEALKAQINELETSVNAQDQALSVLVGAMQGLVGR